jgi:hypothetical protein
MDRSRRPFGHRLGVLLLAAGVLVSTPGCVHRLLATMVYMWQGHRIDAEYTGLEGKRVVVVCRPPASLEYRYAGADRDVAKQVSKLLAQNVKQIDVVKASEIENWTDQQDWDDVNELGEALSADMVVRIDLEHFNLLKGQTLYQGRADVVVTVFDMQNDGEEVWQKELGEVLFPINSAVPVQEKPLQQFRRQFTTVLSEQIARHFYPHDAHVDFANDSLAHR